MYKLLIQSAIDARNNSYSPYSEFSVGAALLTKNDTIYNGANIENASFSATVCAERAAIFSAISNGERNFKAIAIYGGKNNSSDFDYCYPCGICRQILSEFCDENFEIIIVKSKDDYIIKTLSELLPNSFKGDFNE